MALERELWKRMKAGAIELRNSGHHLRLGRIENEASSGWPDVSGTLDGADFWAELKSCKRPKRDSTPIRPKCRPSQDIWHTMHHKAGGMNAFVLIQVGDAHQAKLYLIPGVQYPNVKAATEAELERMSVCSPDISLAELIKVAARGYEVFDY
jgi:hypothetical protein